MRNAVKKRLEDEGWIFSSDLLTTNQGYAEAVLVSFGNLCLPFYAKLRIYKTSHYRRLYTLIQIT